MLEDRRSYCRVHRIQFAFAYPSIFLGLILLATPVLPARVPAEPSCQWILDNWDRVGEVCGLLAAAGGSGAAVELAPDGTLDLRLQFEFVDAPGDSANSTRMEQYLDDLRRIWFAEYPAIDVCGADNWRLKEGNLVASERLPSEPVDSSAVRVCVFDQQVAQGPEFGDACLGVAAGTGSLRRGLILLFPQGDPEPGRIFAHEVGHVFGLVDTYFEDGGSYRSNEWGLLMSNAGTELDRAYLAEIATTMLQCQVAIGIDYEEQISESTCNGGWGVGAPVRWEATGSTPSWATWDTSSYYYILTPGTRIDIDTGGGCENGYALANAGSPSASATGEFMTISASWVGNPDECAAPQDDLIYYETEFPYLRYGWLSWGAEIALDGLGQQCRGYGQDGCCNAWQDEPFSFTTWLSDSSQSVIYEYTAIQGTSAQLSYERLQDHGTYSCSSCDENSQGTYDYISERTITYEFQLGLRPH